MDNDYIECAVQLPDERVIVATKIDDIKGCRNEALLSRTGNLWFFPDGSMYVYYTPTHWRPATVQELQAEREQIARKLEGETTATTAILSDIDKAIEAAGTVVR